MTTKEFRRLNVGDQIIDSDTGREYTIDRLAGTDATGCFIVVAKATNRALFTSGFEHVPEHFARFFERKAATGNNVQN